MKKSFFHKEVIVKRGNVAESFFIVLKGKAPDSQLSRKFYYR